MKLNSIFIYLIIVLFFLSGCNIEKKDDLHILDNDKHLYAIFINKNGEQLLNQYEYYSSVFNEGLAVVTKNKKRGFINKEGKIIIDFSFDKAYPFSNNRALVCKDNKWFYIDKKGNKIGDFLPDSFNDFNNNTFFECETLYNGEFLGDIAFIDTNIIFNDKGHNILSKNLFHMGSMTVETSLIPVGHMQYIKSGYIDSNGNTVIPFIYDKVFDFNNLYAKVENNNKFGYIDKKGKTVIPIIYDKIGDINNELIMAQIDNKYCYIDKSGNIKLYVNNETKTDFVNGRAFLTKTNNDYYCIDKFGKTLFYGNGTVEDIYNEISFIKINSTIKVLDKLGNVIGTYDSYDKFRYKSITNISNEYFIVEKNKKYGIIDHKGKIVIPIDYNKISNIYKDKTFICYKNKMIYYLNTDNKILFTVKGIYGSQFYDGIAVIYKKTLF